MTKRPENSSHPLARWQYVVSLVVTMLIANWNLSGQLARLSEQESTHATNIVRLQDQLDKLKQNCGR